MWDTDVGLVRAKRFETILGVEYVDPARTHAIHAQVPIAVHRDGAFPYSEAPGGTILRNATLARTALALRDAGLLEQRGDPGGRIALARDALYGICQARATLAANGETALATSLDEVATLVAGLAPEAPSSASFVSWRGDEPYGARGAAPAIACP